MMRATRTLAGWVSITIFVISSAIPLLNAHELDLDCGASEQTLTTGGTSAQLRSRQENTPTDFHCVLCHWLRAVSGSQTSTASLDQVVLQQAPAACAFTESTLGLLARCDGPLRAPPAFSA